MYVVWNLELLEKKLSQNIYRLAELREVGDYGDTRRVTAEQATWAVEAASEFIEKIEALLNRII